MIMSDCVCQLPPYCKMTPPGAVTAAGAHSFICCRSAGVVSPRVFAISMLGVIKDWPLNHFSGYISTEFCDLFVNVSEEGIT
jgi:hypothetical protein